MAWFVAHGVFVGVEVAYRSQGDALVNLDIVANDARGTYDDARAVVDGEAFTNLGLRVGGDACLAMGNVRDGARGEWDPECVELVGGAVALGGA